MVKTYAGIGSRETPIVICDTMYEVAGMLRLENFWLNSGGAPGADTAFERGCADPSRMNIFLPWKYFNGSTLPFVQPSRDLEQKAFELAAKHHPGWEYLKQGPRKLMARNGYQILGPNLDEEEKVRFVLCWTPDGCESTKTRSRKTGGTGQAISIADAYGVPVINMFNPHWEERLKEHL